MTERFLVVETGDYTLMLCRLYSDVTLAIL